MDIEQSGQPIQQQYSQTNHNPQIAAVSLMIQNLSLKNVSDLTLQQIKDLARATQRTYQECQQVIKKGAIPLFVQLLKNDQILKVQQALYAIGNMSSDSQKFRDQIINQGGQKAQQMQLKKFVQINSCIIQEYGQLQIFVVVQAIILLNLQIFKQPFNICARKLVKIQQKILRLYRIVQQQFQELQQIQRSKKVINNLFKYISDSSLMLLKKSLIIIGRIIFEGTTQQIDKLIDLGVINKCFILLQNPNETIRRQVCWILSNIAAGTKQQVQKLLDSQVTIQRLLLLFKNDNIIVRGQIAYVLSNITHKGQPNAVLNFYKLNNICAYYLEYLSLCSQNMNQNQKAIQAGLISLLRILKFGNKYKQNHNNIILDQISILNPLNTIHKFQFQNHFSNQTMSTIKQIITFFSSINNAAI